MTDKIVYLDNAATSFPKPPSVIEQAVLCMKKYCGNPGRSSHALSIASSEKLYECRCLIAELVGLSLPENVVFTLNTTYALNIALRALLHNGSHVVTSVMEHNSVLRPLSDMKEKGKITVSYVNTLCSDEELLANISRAASPRTRAVVLCHSSNIISHTLPITKIGQLCKKYGILFILDCAQSAGRFEINMERDDISAVCLPSHKALYGMQGVGAVCFSPSININSLQNFIFGGNGIDSKSSYMPSFLPEKFEGGTLPVPAVASLCEGIRFVHSVKEENIRKHEQKLSLGLLERLQSSKKITLYSKEPGECVLFNVNGVNCEDVCSALSDRGICVRSGLHCAPLAHKRLGSDKLGGGVRVSYGYFNTTRDTQALVDALYKEYSI